MNTARWLKLVFLAGMCVGASLVMPVRASASISATTYGRSCTMGASWAGGGGPAGSPGSVFTIKARCFVNPNSGMDAGVTALASKALTGSVSGTLLVYEHNGSVSGQYCGGPATYDYRHGQFHLSSGAPVGSVSHSGYYDNYFQVEFTCSFGYMGSGFLNPISLDWGNWSSHFNSWTVVSGTDTLGDAQDFPYITRETTPTWLASRFPEYFGTVSPYPPTPCEGVDTTLVKNGVNVTEPITSETVAQGDVMQVRIAFPNGSTPVQTARLDFIPDTSVPTGRRTLGTWPLPNMLADVLVNVTASFQAFDDEAFSLSRTAVRCESDLGFGYDTFDGTNPWGATPLDGSLPDEDADERELSACFSGSGIGINPSSWVPATGRMLGCMASALFVPDSGVVEGEWDELTASADSAVPVSWIVGAAEVLDGTISGLDTSIEANSSDCVYVLPAGTDDFPHDGLFDFCPSEFVVGTGWPVWRNRVGSAVMVMYFLFVGSIAMKMFSMGGGGGGGSSFENQDGAYGENGHYSLV